MINIKEENRGTNEISISAEAYLDSNITLDILGSNNTISIDTPHNCTSLYIRVTGDNHISIKRNCVFLVSLFSSLHPVAFLLENLAASTVTR